jgi:hypothetical protein
MNPVIAPRLTSCAVRVCLMLCASGCVESAAPTAKDEPKIVPDKEEIVVDATAIRASVGPYAFGMHTSVYDNALHSAALPTLLPQAGIKLLRYPGGGYSDNYHWSTHEMTPWADGSKGYLANKSDFGNYVSVLESTGTTAMITVNYGSNLDGTGPGEPNEAAAWVAYANGQPDDETVIGPDSTGRDWNTVGYWASMRAASPLSVDDGYNFLRIAHPAPLQLEYWEVGNELFGNGYYSTNYEFDLHAPYVDTKGTGRAGNADLSPTTYGQGVVAYARAMKAVDPSIRVGAALVTPPADYTWAPNWNRDVLKACGKSIDFATVHYYPIGSGLTLLDVPRADVPQIFAELRKNFKTLAGANAPNIEVAVTELGPKTSDQDPLFVGIFATEAYATFIDYGAVNVDWLELHNGSFLSERNPNLGPAYRGIQMVHTFTQPGDSLVQAKATVLGIVAHAALRSDQTLSLLLVNMNTLAAASIPVTIAGPTLSGEGTRTDYQRQEGATSGDGTISGPTPMSGLGNEFNVDLAPLSVSVITIPVAPSESTLVP